MTPQKSAFPIINQTFESPLELICCACGLRDCEVEVYYFLLENGPMKVEELRDLVEAERQKSDREYSIDRSTLQRTLKRLLEHELVGRETRHLERGGYYYEYYAISSEEVKERLLKQLDEWYQQTRNFLLKRWAEPQ